MIEKSTILRKRWKSIILKSKYRKNSVTAFPSLHDINSILIISSKNNEEILKLIDDFHHNSLLKDKKINAIIIKNKKDICQSTENISFIDKKEFSIVRKITNNDVISMLDENYDLLLNLDMSCNMHSLYLSSVSKANFKVAIFSDFNSQIFDFMIKISEGSNSDFLIKQTIYYLNRNNNK